MLVFNEYLRTNYVPTEFERGGIERRIGELKDDSLKLSGDISSLQSTLVHMKQRKDTLQATLDNHRRILSRFRTLPDSILVTIFLCCLPDSHNATIDANEPPLLLGRVCRRWRYVAYNSPRLWANLHITIPSYPVLPFDASDEEEKTSKATILEYDRKSALQLAVVKQWLLRTGLSPLSISLHPPYPVLGQTYIHHQPYLDLLLPHLNRLQALDITVRTSEMSQFFAKIAPHEVPMLETIRIIFFDNGYSPQRIHPETWNDSGLLQAKKLRTVDVPYLPFSPSPFLARWSQLTRLEIMYYNRPWQPKGLALGDAYIILSHCFNLLHCSLEISDVYEAVSPSGPICLPVLESIYVLDKAFHSATLFNVLSIPALKHVRYYTKFDSVPGRPSPLLRLLACSSVPIEKLATNLASLNLTELVECFRLTPYLTHFLQEKYDGRPVASPYFTFSPYPIDFIQAAFEFLIPDKDGNCFWKRLARIHVEDVSRITDQDVLRFVERRMDISASSSDIATLKYVQINLYHPMRDEIRPMFSRYTENVEGLKLALKYPLPINYKGYFRWKKKLKS